MRKFCYLLISIWLLMPALSHAAPWCYVVNGISFPADHSRPAPWVINVPPIPPIAVGANTPNGAVIAELPPVPFIGPYSPWYLMCGGLGSTQNFAWTTGVTAMSSYANVYTTSVQGIGLKFVLGCSACGGVFPSHYDTDTWINRDLSYGAATLSLYIKVIKIGPVVEGGSISGTIAKLTQADFGDLILWNANSPIIIQPDIPTCSISVGDVNKVVTLDPVKVGDFNTNPGIGDKSFTLTVDNCQSNPATANFTFTGTPDGSNPVIFKNGADAQGVGVRLYTTSDNQTIGANDTTNVRTVPVTSGQAVLGLTAQYYKTGASVGAGQVSSRITVTTSYN